VNNAGANRLGPFAYTKPAEWWRLMTVNVLGPMTVTFPVLNSMRKHNKGVIINVASRAGVVTGGFSSAYSSSKAALIRATGNIQQELNMEGKDRISMFSLHPGGVKTSMNERMHHF
jgi:short-subunit dehydrogenase